MNSIFNRLLSMSHICKSDINKYVSAISINSIFTHTIFIVKLAVKDK